MEGIREKVGKLLAEGKSLAEIGRLLGISNSTACYHKQRLGLPMNPKCARRHDWQAIAAAKRPTSAEGTLGGRPEPSAVRAAAPDYASAPRPDAPLPPDTAGPVSPATDPPANRRRASHGGGTA